MPIYSDSTLCEALAGGLVTGTTSRVRCGPKGAAPAAPPPNAPNPPDLRGPLPGCKTASGRPKREVATCEGSVLGRLDETIPRNRERRSQLDGIYLFLRSKSKQRSLVAIEKSIIWKLALPRHFGRFDYQ